MRWVLVLLAGCGRLGFEPLDTDASPDAFDESRCMWGTPIALDDLNTGDNESEPALSPDGTKIVFSSKRIGNIDRLFIAMRTGNGWTTPSLIDPFDSGMGDGGPSWNADGTRFYYSSYRAGPLRLYQSTFDGSVFTAPELVPGLEELAESLAPTVHSDELEMFFSTRLPPSRIEYATRATTSSSWISRGNVPELVATLDHGYPGTSADGLTLYFEVERPGAGFFIARTRRPSLGQPFGAVEAVAELDVTGSGGDPQPSFDGTEIVFSASPAGRDNFDLFLSTRVCN